jgi:hypothetical protein
MKTALSVVALVLLAAAGCTSSSVAEQADVTTSPKPTTRLYVRTTPEGADVSVDGKQRGKAPQLFEVPPGVKSMLVEVELAGQGKQKKVVAIEGGRIVRVEFKFEDRVRPSPRTPPRGVSARSIRDRVMNPPEGWKVERSFMVSEDQTAAIAKKLGGQIKHLSNTFLSAHDQHVQVNVIECQTESDADRVHHAILAMKGDPAYCLQFRQVVVEFVGTFDASFAKRAARELRLPAEAPRSQLQRIVDQARREARPPVGPPGTVMSGAPKQLAFGPVVEQVLKDPKNRVAELLDLDTGRRATMEGFGEDDRQTHAWIRQQKVDVMGAIEHGLPGLLLFDCAVYENPGISWEKITPQEILDHRGLDQTEPKPIVPLATQDPSKLPLTCLFETREKTKGVLQLVGLSDDKQGVKIRYKLVRQVADTERDESHAQTTAESRRLRYFVRLVVGEDHMTFEGKDTTWEELPKLLQKVPNREHTALEVAIPSDEVTLQHKSSAVGRAERLARQSEFEYLSFIGVHPLGSKGSPPQRVPDTDHARRAKQPAKKVHLPDADTRGVATVLDLASGEIFPFPEIDGPPDLMVFTRLGKGDLFFDRVLGCPRGATAMQWDGQRFVSFPPKEQIEDARAYELPALPCRLLITTAENKHFDVTVLATGDDGGIDLEYREADPAVVPKGSDPDAMTPARRDPSVKQGPKRVHLPDIEGGPGATSDDFRGLKCILDFASGKMLAFPEGVLGKRGPLSEFFAQQTEGDLFYAGRSLFCLRGAKAMRWEGNRFTAMQPGDYVSSGPALKGLSRYELPKVPSRLLITTAEKKHFDVTIHAVGDDGGIDLEYAPADPAVVPK